MKLKNDSKGFVGLLLVFFVVVLLVIAGGFYAIKTGLVKIPGLNQISLDQVTNRIVEKPVVKPNQEQPIVPDSNKVYKVDFAYTVKSITPEQIVLNGQNGDFTLPNDPSIVTVYKGPTKESPKMELSQLKVGDTLNMEFIPGKSATLFLIR